MHSKLLLRYVKFRILPVICFFCLFTINNSYLETYNSVALASFFGSVKAFLYRTLNISTDMKIYLCESENVFAYSQYNFRYLINNEDRCKAHNPLVLIFVKAHSKDFEARKIIRETWGNVTSWNKFGVKDEEVVVLFALGKNKHFDSPQMQAIIQRENEKFHDIIQEDYIENFHNLTLKVVCQMKWPLKYCRGAAFWMTTDSDVFVHVGNLVSHLRKQRRQGYYSGLVHSGAHRIPDLTSKYFVSTNVYKGAYYPDYCPGGGYVLSLDMVKKFFETVPFTPLLYIDDVYVGVLANSCGITPVHYGMLMGERKTSTDLCTLSKFLTSHGHCKIKMKEFYDEIMLLSVLNPDIVCWNKSLFNPFDLVMF